MSIENIIKEAEKLNFVEELLEWEQDFKLADPSLDELKRYELSLLACKENSVGYRFERSTVNVDIPKPYKKVGNKMYELLQIFNDKQENGGELVTKTYSQIGQDIFVNNILQEKKNGLFFDIGAGPPIFINNTYLFESDYCWDGVSIDAGELCRIQWLDSDRNSQFLCADALTLDYDNIISDLLKKHNKDRIDYLSVDLEPPSLTLEVLFKLITHTKHRFSTITFEHDSWREAEHILKTSRQLLERYGYVLVADNVNNQEDWWIDGTY